MEWKGRRRQAKASEQGVASEREQETAGKTGLLVGGEDHGTLTKSVVLGISMKEVPRSHGKKEAKKKAWMKFPAQS